MTDVMDPEARSRLMSRIRSTDSRPEMTVRRTLHSLGYRFRLNRRDLPGTPDIVFPARRKVIFVHGCFWHDHECRRGRRPTTNADFWSAKLDANVVRDRRVLDELNQIGWQSCVVWECDCSASRLLQLEETLIEFLGPTGSPRRRSPASQSHGT